jgi:T-complex protein 1 subunit gamma
MTTTTSPARCIAGEILAQSLSQLERDIHPVVIISAYNKALQTALEIVSRISVPIDTSDDTQMLALIKSSIGTKFVIRWADLMCRLALEAIRTVSADDAGVRTVDIKRYARVEKVPGGEIENSRVLSGVMLNKDIVHPQMRRRIHDPRIVLLDCPLEYKKGESQTNIEISKEADFARINQIEEEQVKAMVDRILEFKPDLVITEKGISGSPVRSSAGGVVTYVAECSPFSPRPTDYAQYFFAKASVSALRRVRKSDNNRIARAVGATIVNRVEDLRESDIGTRCGLFNVEKIGDE